MNTSVILIATAGVAVGVILCLTVENLIWRDTPQPKLKERSIRDRQEY